MMQHPRATPIAQSADRLYPADLAPKLTALTEYLRWNSRAPRLSEMAILITPAMDRAI